MRFALTVAAHLALKILDLGQGGVLATGAQEVAQVGEGDTAVAALVEEGEGLLEVGALRLLVGHAASVDCVFCGWMEWLCAEECSDCDGASRSAAARECVDGVLLTVRCGDLAFAGSLAGLVWSHARKGRCRVLFTYHLCRVGEL